MLATFGQCADRSLCPHLTYRGSNGALAQALGLWFVVLVMVVALALGTGGLEAATFNVTTNADSGASSLRQAVDDASAGDTITFDANLGTITLTTGGDLEKSHTNIFHGDTHKLRFYFVPIRRFLFRILTDHDKRSTANLTALRRQLDPSHRSKEITA